MDTNSELIIKYINEMLSPQEMKLFKQRIQQDKTLNREYQMTIALRDASNQ